VFVSVAVATLLVSAVMSPAKASSEDRDVVVAAGQPHAYTINGAGAEVRHIDFLWSLGGGRPRAGEWARDYVHRGDFCFRGNFCTIQIFNNDRYRVYYLQGCGLFGLDNFTGLFDTHNHRSNTVHLLGPGGNADILSRYAPDRDDPVNWSPVWRIRTCP
jgi:hypothetical protein